MLEEMDEKLGCSSYDYRNEKNDDSRNGYHKKAVISSMGEIDLDIPRDRKGSLSLKPLKRTRPTFQTKNAK